LPERGKGDTGNSMHEGKTESGLEMKNKKKGQSAVSSLKSLAWARGEEDGVKKRGIDRIGKKTWGSGDEERTV